MKNLELLLREVLKKLEGLKKCKCTKCEVTVEVHTVADVPTAEANTNFNLAEVEELATDLASVLSNKELVTLFLCLNTEVIERGLTKEVLDTFNHNNEDNN